MASRTQSREDFIRSCTVRVEDPESGRWGTGFFVSEELVLTCAHVCGQQAEVGKLFRLFSPDAVPNRIDALVERIIPAEWVNESTCYPDVALLRVNTVRRGRPVVKLRGEYRPHDLIWGNGYSRDRPYGDTFSGHISGTVTFGGEGQATDPDYRLIKFISERISPGLSGSPVVNLRTGRVCGMIKKTRDPDNDSGGFAVRVPVILTHLSDRLRESEPTRGNRIVRSLQATFGNRKSALQGTGIYTTIVLVLGSCGLLFSYGVFSSPAWQADYGYAFATSELVAANLNPLDPDLVDAKGNFIDVTKASKFLLKHNPWRGFLIELVRLLILALLFFVLTAFIFNNTYVQIDEIPAPFTQGWWRSFGTGLLLSMLIFVFFGLTTYHLLIAPSILSSGGKYWSSFKSISQLWSSTPSLLSPEFWESMRRKALTRRRVC